MKIKFYIPALIFSLLAISSCKKNDNIEQNLQPILNQLTIKAANNSSIINSDIVATINEDSGTATLDIPQGFDKFSTDGCVISYKIQGDRLTYNGSIVDSTAKMQIDNGGILKVLNEKGISKQYTLKLKNYTDRELAITSFSVLQDKNSEIFKNYYFTISNDTVYGVLNAAHTLLIPSITSSAKSILIDGTSYDSTLTKIEFSQSKHITLISSRGFKKDYFLSVNLSSGIPMLNIHTQDNAAITSKDNYVKGELSLDGMGLYNDYSGSLQIKGRGNSTWLNPKKPYRIKLDKKASLMGLSEEKDWVLLANYMDGSGLTNAVAFKIGELIQMPYTNHMIPVEVTLNDTYIGLYLFTEQVEVEKNRVNIGDDGILFELDKYYDEDWKFKSNNYQLPVMIKSPDLSTSSDLTPIKNDFNAMEALVSASTFPGNNYLSYVNDSTLVQFLFTCMLCDNEEINHPKSTYMYKYADNSKYYFGPLWDFDWAYGYENNNAYFKSYNHNFFWTGSKSSTGTKFFSRLLSDPHIKSMLSDRITSFQTSGKMTQLINYITDYASLVRNARNKDYAVWKNASSDFDGTVSSMKAWLQNRIAYLDAQY